MTISIRALVRGDSIIREMGGKSLTYAKEVPFQGHPQWDNSWTTNSTYTDITGSLIELDFNDWPNHAMYLEMIGKTDMGTGYWRLYNITDSGAVSNSEISTTSTSAVRIRSSALPKLTQTKSFKIQHKIEGGDGTNDFVNSIMSKVIFRADI